MDARSLALAGSIVRGAWGLGALAAPGAMRKAQLTGGGPDLDRADARLYVRGFGGHQLLIAGFTIAALRSDELLRPALVLSVLSARSSSPRAGISATADAMSSPSSTAPSIDSHRTTSSVMH